VRGKSVWCAHRHSFGAPEWAQFVEPKRALISDLVGRKLMRI
jgi:hypothetical protein